MSKLTIDIDPEILAAAEDYSRQQGISLSGLVSRYLSELIENREDEFISRLHEELKKEGYRSSETDAEDLRRRHIADKYL